MSVSRSGYRWTEKVVVVFVDVVVVVVEVAVNGMQVSCCSLSEPGSWTFVRQAIVFTRVLTSAVPVLKLYWP